MTCTFTVLYSSPMSKFEIRHRQEQTSFNIGGIKGQQRSVVYSCVANLSRCRPRNRLREFQWHIFSMFLLLGSCAYHCFGWHYQQPDFARTQSRVMRHYSYSIFWSSIRYAQFLSVTYFFGTRGNGSHDMFWLSFDCSTCFKRLSSEPSWCTSLSCFMPCTAVANSTSPCSQPLNGSSMFL